MSEIPTSKMWPGLALLVGAALLAGVSMLARSCGDTSCADRRPAVHAAMMAAHQALLQKTADTGVVADGLAGLAIETEVDGFVLTSTALSPDATKPDYMVLARDDEADVVIEYRGREAPTLANGSRACR